jgi:hypothetical protein
MRLNLVSAVALALLANLLPKPTPPALEEAKAAPAGTPPPAVPSGR